MDDREVETDADMKKDYKGDKKKYSKMKKAQKRPFEDEKGVIIHKRSLKEYFI